VAAEAVPAEKLSSMTAATSATTDFLKNENNR
jgi:hypothetical protein